jgi:hypothetical protein
MTLFVYRVGTLHIPNPPVNNPDTPQPIQTMMLTVVWLRSGNQSIPRVSIKQSGGWLTEQRTSTSVEVSKTSNSSGGESEILIFSSAHSMGNVYP